MNVRLPMLVGVLMVLVAAAEPQPTTQEDFDRFQGTWSVLALVNDGQPMPAAALKNAEFIVEGTHYAMRGVEDSFRGSFTLNPKASPKAIDSTFVDTVGKEQGRARGIYEFRGDRLIICWSEQGARPTELASKPGSGTRLIELRREK
jgi:uncharacterized protein (TIGR03067 family)